MIINTERKEIFFRLIIKHCSKTTTNGNTNIYTEGRNIIFYEY